MKDHHNQEYPGIEQNRATKALPYHQHPLSLQGPLAHVHGIVTHVFVDLQSHHGADHQHFTVKIAEVVRLEGAPLAPETLIGQTVFVAVRFGDGMGLESPIKGLAEDAPIELQGEYISAAEAYPTEDNNGNPPLPVLHFTHHPVGFVIYGGHKYS